MGKTLAEKILSQKLGRDVSSGEIVVSPVDLAFVQDTTGPLTVREYQGSGFKALADKRRTALFLDHAAPSPTRNSPQTTSCCAALLKRRAACFPTWAQASATRSWPSLWRVPATSWWGPIRTP